MNLIRGAQITAIFFTGLFSGLMLTFWLVIQRMLVTLPGPDYTRIMQGLIRGADEPPVVPAIVVISLLAPLFVLFALRRDRQSRAFRLTLWALAIFTLGVFVVTVGFNAPINNIIMKWSPTPPDNWMQTRDQWNNLNIIRTPASSITFFLHLLALCQPLPQKASER